MRIQRKRDKDYIPKLGDQRTIRRFCIWRTIGKETRCLEWTSIIQEYRSCLICEEWGTSSYYWEDIAWENQ